MQRRTVVFGDYNTADYGWTLTGYSLSAPEQKTNYVEKSGGDGSWDMSTVMSDGIPRYKDRNLTVNLENSEGDRINREFIISEMVNYLDGMEWKIVLPDRPDHYVTGRLHVAVDYSDMAHAAVTVTGIVGPWLECTEEKIYSRTAAEIEQEVMLINGGRRVIVPEIVVTGSILLVFGDSSIELSAGTYTWSALVLTPGMHKLVYSGEGTLTVRYREAVLR